MIALPQTSTIARLALLAAVAASLSASSARSFPLTSKGEVRLYVDAAGYDRQMLSISDIQLGSFIEEAEAEGALVKNGVYIVYGPPSAVERDTVSTTGEALETWTCEKDSRDQFVFLDRWGQGVFQLVHSGMPGDIQNPEGKDGRWYRQPSDGER